MFGYWHHTYRMIFTPLSVDSQNCSTWFQTFVVNRINYRDCYRILCIRIGITICIFHLPETRNVHMHTYNVHLHAEIVSNEGLLLVLSTQVVFLYFQYVIK